MSRSRDWSRARDRERARPQRRELPLIAGTPPTPKQLHYLRILADRARCTFVQPRTRAAASQEIQRLRALLQK